MIGVVSLGEQASVWPGCVLRGDINSIEIGDRTDIQDGAVIGAYSIVGARALITAGTQVPLGSVATGSPTGVTRGLSAEELVRIKKWATKYVIVSDAHKALYRH